MPWQLTGKRRPSTKEVLARCLVRQHHNLEFPIPQNCGLSMLLSKPVRSVVLPLRQIERTNTYTATRLPFKSVCTWDEFLTAWILLCFHHSSQRPMTCFLNPWPQNKVPAAGYLRTWWSMHRYLQPEDE